MKGRRWVKVAAGFFALLGVLGIAAHAEIVPEAIVIAVLVLPSYPLVAFSQLLASEPVREGLLWLSLIHI